MRMYRGESGAWFRTQADGKASGEPFEPVEVPTDHHGLHAFLNSLATPPAPAPELIAFVNALGARVVGVVHDEVQWDVPPVGSDEDMAYHRATGAQLPKSEEDRAAFAARYLNGDPTTPFMGSRDPRAVFICTNCGKSNVNP